MTTIDLHFALHPNHTYDESVKEMHAKTAANVHPHRTVMEAMNVADVAYENVCSNARAVAAARPWLIHGSRQMPVSILQPLQGKDPPAGYPIDSGIGYQ